MTRLTPVLIFVVGLTACAGGGLPPVSDQSPNLEKPAFVDGVFRNKGSSVVPATYSVRAGDTLYSIAWRFNRDFKDIARYNSIAPPYLIQPEEKLSLSSYAQKRSVPKPERKGQKSSPTKRSYAVTPRNGWHWPANGLVIRGYGKTNAGVDIRVKRGTSVVASAEGEVVYAGRGLRGFEHLIIIKHSEQTLSAYGLNQKLFVREGQVVKAGTRLADITATGVAQETLHFEIRRNGNHLNPRTYIKGSG